MSNAWTAPGSNSDVPATLDLSDMGTLFGESWRLLKENPAPVAVGLGLGLAILTVGMVVWYAVMMVAMFGLAGLAVALQEGLGVSEDVAGLITGISSLVVLMALYVPMIVVMTAGQMLMFRGGLDTARGLKPDVGSMFQGIARRTMVALGVVALMVLALIPAALLLYIPAIYLGMRWSLALHYVFDTNLGVMDSLRASWRATEGKVLDLFVKHLVFGLVSTMIGIFTCYLGFLVMMPLQMVYSGLLFMHLSGRHQAGLPDPDLAAV